MPVPDRAFAGVGSHLEILSELETIGGASIFAQTAEHAARSVVRKSGEHFAPRCVVAVPTDYNQIFWAGQRAEIAGNTESFPGLRIHVQAWRPPVSFRHHGALQRILLGIIVLRVLGAEGQHQSLPKI